MRRLFWTNFFSLLLVFVAVAQWVCAAWLLAELGGVGLAPSAHVLAPLAIYLINRTIVTRSMPAPGPVRVLRRAYTAVAFTSVFGLLFLAATSVVWLLAWSGAAALAMAAGAELTADSLSRPIRALATTGLVTIAVTMAYGYAIGQRRLWINRFDTPVENLPEDLLGFRIVQLSDIHLGGFTSPEQIARYVRCVNEIDPDMVVITGDITDGLDHAGETFPVLGRLRARHGVIAILGNHDVYTGEEAVTATLRRLTDFTVLLDEIAPVRVGSATLHVIGLRDRGLDWARGVVDCPVLAKLHAEMPRDRVCLLLTHRPDLFAHAARLGVPLTLSGHTHGGQVGLPLGRGRTATLARFMTRFPRGTYREGASLLHVNLGLGLTGQPVRLATPREITEITLVAA